MRTSISALSFSAHLFLNAIPRLVRTCYSISAHLQRNDGMTWYDGNCKTELEVHLVPFSISAHFMLDFRAPLLQLFSLV